MNLSCDFAANNDSHCYSIMSYLYPKAYKRHIGVTHCYYMSQLFVEGTHFSRPLWLLWLWVPVFPRHLQDGKKNVHISHCCCFHILKVTHIVAMQSPLIVGS